MVMFTNDTMVIPKESEWFAFYSPGQDKEIMPLEQSVLYLTVSNYIENQKLILIIGKPSNFWQLMYHILTMFI